MNSTMSMPLSDLAAAPRARSSRPAYSGAAGLLAALVMICLLTLGGFSEAMLSRLLAALPIHDAVATIGQPVQTARYDPIDGRSRVVHWNTALAAFAEADRKQPPAVGGVVFIGSSSIRLWASLEADFPQIRIVKRGFGGSRLSDTAYYSDRLILPYAPRQVVVYAGDNDIAGGASPEDVLASFDSLVRQVHARFPETRISFVSIKPSPARTSLQAQTQRANELIADYVRAGSHLDFVDIYSRMVDANGRPRPELFEADKLHPSAAGYAVWRAAIADHLI